ncbi:hypothetical protein [Salinispora fenicalii]|uniref:hypothetical protein n=1 Tax=Salinispora fenicalii TaxID=1137263 RepID=UPI0009EC140F|nr:hypothetical protein [Salinispora fenicalii]
MADDRRPPPHRNRDPYGTAPLPDGDRVHRKPEPDLPPITAGQKLTALLCALVIVAAVVIGALR